MSVDDLETQGTGSDVLAPAVPQARTSPPPGGITEPPVAAAPDRAPVEPIDVAALRHPYEQSRFAVAASATVLLVGALAVGVWVGGGVVSLLAGVATVALVLPLVWIVVQVFRSSLMGRAVRVTEVTFPDLHRAATSVRRRLGYEGHVEVFVIDRAPAPISTTSYLGTRILLIEGDLVAELTKPENRAQLEFALATHYGALKAAHDVWTPALLVMSTVRQLRVLDFLVAPWLRATVYTGDHIAMAACGRLDESVVALNRVAVGTASARTVGVPGIIEQAAAVRRGWLTRVQQLYAVTPHVTNRYLNLLAFAEETFPDQADAFRRSLPATTAALVPELVAREPHHRGLGRPTHVVPVAVGVSCAVVLLLAVVAAAAGGEQEPLPLPPPPSPTPEVPPEPVVPPEPEVGVPPEMALGQLLPGTSTSGAVDPDGAARAELVVEVGGLYTVYVAGEDGFDPVLSVLSPSGDVLAEDDDSGGEGGALLELELAAGEEVSLLVHGFSGSPGSFVVGADLTLPLLGPGESVVVHAEEGSSTMVGLTETTGTFVVGAEPVDGTDPLLQHVSEDGVVHAEDDDSGVGLASELLVDATLSHLLAVTLVAGTGEVLLSVE